MVKPQKQKAIFLRTLTYVSLVLFVVISIISLLSPNQQVAHATTNNTINFQARILTNTGNVVADGSYNVEFKIYKSLAANSSTPGTCNNDCLWMEDWTSGNKITTKNGYVTAALGSITGFGALNWDQQLWLTIDIGGTGAPSWDGEMTPRMTMTAVPYAIAAGQLQTSASVAGYTSKLSVTSPTVGSQTFVVQDQAAAGTYYLCIQNSASCGFAPSSGGTGYVQLQGSTPGTQQTGNMNISGAGIFGGSLTVTGHSAFGSSASVNAAQVISVSETITPSGADVYGNKIWVNASSAFASNALYGMQAMAAASHSSGTANYLVGVMGSVNNNSTGTIDKAYGGIFTVETNTAGVINNAYGVRSLINNMGSGTIGTAYGIRVDSAVKGSGSITTNYGLYVDNQTAGTTNYSIYSNGGQSYFAGNVGVGIATPSAKLSVAGSSTDKAYFFYDNANVGDTTDGQGLYVYRRAAEGDNYVKIYVDQYVQGNITSSGVLQVGSSSGSPSAITFTTSGYMQTSQPIIGTRFDSFAGLSLGTSNASSISIGQSGVTTTNYGPLTVSQLLTGNSGAVLKGTTSDNSAAALNVTNSGSTSLLYVRNDGNVGIGTTSPEQKLTVSGDISIPTANKIYFDVGTGNHYIGWDYTTQGIMVNGWQGVSLGYQGNKVLTTNYGKVGIGTTSPLSALQVVGTSSVATVSGSNSLTADGTFATSSGWTTTAGWTIGSGVATHTTGNTGALSGTSNGTNTSTVYQVMFDVAGTMGSGFNVSLGGTDSGTTITSTGSAQTVYIVPGASSGTLAFTPAGTGTFAGTIDNVYIYAISTSTADVSVISSNGTSTPLEVRAGGSGLYNTFIGQNSGLNNTTGYSNSALGAGSLQYNSIGYYNAAVGARSLQKNTTGYYNSVLGVEALQNNTTGNWNVAVGTWSLNSNTTGGGSTAVGYGSLQNNNAGGSNSAFGAAALGGNTGGYNNSALGYAAGSYISGGSNPNQYSYNSVYLGMNTEALASGDYNETVIGYGAIGVGNNSVTLGNNAITAVQLGNSQTSGNTAGTNITVSGAGGYGTGAGGNLTLQAGSGGSTSTGGAGGITYLYGGNAGATNANGGNVTISPGTKAGSGTAGSVIIKPQASN
ncbi:MAG TPA: hypothetical protein VMR51_02740, partial [Patescibacteria group bacterium]|nr:hypothetical protein [Patescibacteria group bacterium]